MIGALEISNDAAGKVAAALAPDVPDERVFVDWRDSFALPHAMVYVEAAGASGTVEYDGTLVVHGWGKSMFAAGQLADRVPGAVVGFHSLDDGAYRVRRGGLSYLREDEAAHYTWRFPIAYDAQT